MATGKQQRITLGEALRAGRIAAGYGTQQKGAEAAGFREKDLSRWESGRDKPHGLTLAKLYQVYYPHVDLMSVNTDGDTGRYPYLELLDTG